MDTREFSAADLGARAQRGLALYRARQGEYITPWGNGIYTIPSATGDDLYVVDYRQESCTCPDYRYRGEPCKHVYAVGILRAKVRGRLREALGVLS